MPLITLGLSQVEVGVASVLGAMPSTLNKIGKTYTGSCKLVQGTSDVTEHFEEGRSAPEVRKKLRKLPILTFSLMDPDVANLIEFVGGAATDITKWGFSGTETVSNKAVRVRTDQGFFIDIPNADIEAVINADLSTKGIFLVDFTITPLAVSAGKSIMAYDGSTQLAVAPLLLAFTNAANTVGLTITATSTGNLTFASAPNDIDWITVNRAGKVATVRVTANANSESRTANVTIIADGITAVVPVTQAGV